MKISKLFYDKVLVKPYEVKESEGGIVLPQGMKDEVQFGIVLKTGPGRLIYDTNPPSRFPIDKRVGEVVGFSKHVGTVFSLNNQKLILLNDQDIWMTLTSNVEVEKGSIENLPKELLEQKEE